MFRNKALPAWALLAAVAAVGMISNPKNGVDVLFAPTGDDRLIQKRLVREISSAKRRISVAIYQFTSRDVAQALANAKRKGVDVRVLVDGVQAEKMEGPWAEALEILEAAKVPIRRVVVPGDRGKSEAMRPKFHHKFAVIDNDRVITGSYNWTVLADEENHENLIILGGTQVAARFQEQFEKIWKDEKLTSQ